nr:hypothetical protein [Chicken picobirnavirus]
MDLQRNLFKTTHISFLTLDVPTTVYRRYTEFHIKRGKAWLVRKEVYND